MAVTIKQIAQKAGVSCGTVDRALHNRPGVNAEVAKRIREIAEELHYRPNTFAKELASTDKNRDIAVVLHAWGNDFYTEVLRGMNKAADEYAAYGVTLSPTLLKGYDKFGQSDALKKLLASPPAGLIITPVDTATVARDLTALAKAHTRIVTLNADLPGFPKLSFVGCDYYASGQTAAELFGMMFSPHKAEVAVVAGSLHQSDHKQRVNGFTDTLQDAFPDISVVQVIENDDDEELSEQLVTRLAEQSPALDGIYFCAGGVAGGLRAVTQHFAQLPRIVTVDETTTVKKALAHRIVQATVTQNPFEQGYQAVKAVCEKLLFNTDPPARIIMQNEIRLHCHAAADAEACEG